MYWNYEYKDKNLGGSLLLCPLSRIIVLSSFHGAHKLANHNILAYLTIVGMSSILRADFLSNQKAVGYSYNICVTTAPVSTSYQVSHYHNLQ